MTRKIRARRKPLASISCKADSHPQGKAKDGPQALLPLPYSQKVKARLLEAP